MKFLFVFLVVFCPLFGQSAGSVVLYTGGEMFEAPNPDAAPYNVKTDDYLTYTIYRNPDGSKTFVFSVSRCVTALVRFNYFDNLFFISNDDQDMACRHLSQSAAIQLGPVQEAIGDFLSDSSDAPHHIVYKVVKPLTTPAQAPTSGSPQMTILDNYSTDRILKLDLTTFAIVNPVNLPDEPTAFAVRPSVMGATNEVWIANAVGPGNEISIADLGVGKLLGVIQTSSLAPNINIPAGIVFTNDGSKALCAVSYFAPDSSGNLGALLVYDAVNRKLTSTLPLKFAPTTLLMAPDGLTAYIVSGQQTGAIAYYDVLSGTADLTVTRIGAFSGPAFIHPDGTRLFWDAGQLTVFDLTTRKIVNQFKFGLPSTSATSMQLSQDGSRAYVGNGAGAVVILDTRYGNILGTFQSPGAAQVFDGPPIN